MFALPDNFPCKTFFLSFTVAVLFLALDVVQANPLIHTLRGEINNHNITPIIKALHNAKPKDTVTLLINSRGGSVFSALKLIKAMRESKAGAVVVHVHQYAFNAAALIALEADDIILDPNARLDFFIMNDDLCTAEVLKSTVIHGHRGTWFKGVFEHSNATVTESTWPTLARA